FRPGKRRAVEHHHVEPALGEEDGAGRPGRACADHDDVAHEATIRTRAIQGMREITMRARRAFSASTPSSWTEYARRTESGPSWREIGCRASTLVASHTRTHDRRPRRRSL